MIKKISLLCETQLLTLSFSVLFFVLLFFEFLNERNALWSTATHVVTFKTVAVKIVRLACYPFIVIMFWTHGCHWF